MLVDTHCHLDFKVLTEDLEGVLNRAKESGVGVLQTICTKISEFEKIHKIANLRENIFCSVGNHPLNLNEEGLVLAAEILKYTKKAKVIGIGETGLDYHYSKDTEQLQKQSFIEHIKAAQESSLPIIVHTREADEDTVEILKHQMKIKPFLGVIHCFTASEWLALECVQMGFYISASGIVTFKNATEIRAAFRKIPLDKILIETDSPFLAPVPQRGKSNEPSYIRYTAQCMAELLEMELEDFVDATTNNFFNLFKKAKISLDN
jgi:TatD DNase family protein